MDAEFTKYLATLGIGGVLAGFMFMFYRKDIKQYTELWKVTTDQLMITVKENTSSNTKLVALIENQERNSLRKEDIQNIINSKIMDRVENGIKDKNV